MHLFTLLSLVCFCLTGAKNSTRVPPVSASTATTTSTSASTSTITSSTAYEPSTEELFFLDVLANPRGHPGSLIRDIFARRREIFEAALSSTDPRDSCNQALASIELTNMADEEILALLDTNVNCTGFLYSTPLIVALENDRLKLALQLIARGALARPRLPGLYTESETLLTAQVGAPFYARYDFERLFTALLPLSGPPSAFVIDVMALQPTGITLGILDFLSRVCPGSFNPQRFVDLRALVSGAEIRNSNDPAKFRKILAEKLVGNRYVSEIESWARVQ